MRNEPPQQSNLPNLFETAPNDVIDEDEGIQDIEEGTFVALISNTIQDCMYFSIPSFNPDFLTINSSTMSFSTMILGLKRMGSNILQCF